MGLIVIGNQEFENQRIILTLMSMNDHSNFAVSMRLVSTNGSCNNSLLSSNSRYVTSFDCASPVGCAGETPTIPAKTNFGTFSVTDLVSIRGMSSSA